jgi:hypothetical protein
MPEDTDLEYAEVCLTIRHYSGLRFGMRTLFLVITIGLAVVGLGIIPDQTLPVKAVARALGALVTAFFWVAERNTARYMSHLEARAADLEERLGYRLWSGMPRSKWWFVEEAFITALVYTCLALFWFGAMIVARWY